MFCEGIVVLLVRGKPQQTAVRWARALLLLSPADASRALPTASRRRPPGGRRRCLLGAPRRQRILLGTTLTTEHLVFPFRSWAKYCRLQPKQFWLSELHFDRMSAHHNDYTWRNKLPSSKLPLDPSTSTFGLARHGRRSGHFQLLEHAWLGLIAGMFWLRVANKAPQQGFRKVNRSRH